jgi:hypothetical protein
MKSAIALFTILSLLSRADAKLVVKQADPKTTSSKTLVKLTLQNTFSAKVESARATMFLIDTQDKIVGQATQWVIGGTQEKPALASNASTTFNFVIASDKPFTKTKLIFNRIVLEGGKQVDPVKNFEIEQN